MYFIVFKNFKNIQLLINNQFNKFKTWKNNIGGKLWFNKSKYL